jgi:hypothetical protein
MKIELGELASQALPAAAGAFVSLRALPGATLAQRITNFAAGVSIAAFGAPALIEHMQIQSAAIGGAIIFITGATGLVAFDALIEAIKKTDFVAWIAGWLPGRKGGQ